VLAEFLGGPRDGLVTEVAMSPRMRLRVPIAGDVAAWSVLVIEGEDRLTYAYEEPT
jgi:hypothetical protein